MAQRIVATLVPEDDYMSDVDGVKYETFASAEVQNRVLEMANQSLDLLYEAFGASADQILEELFIVGDSVPIDRVKPSYQIDACAPMSYMRSIIQFDPQRRKVTMSAWGGKHGMTDVTSDEVYEPTQFLIRHCRAFLQELALLHEKERERAEDQK